MIDDWSQSSDAFKTISFDSDTRNPTTNKKYYRQHHKKRFSRRKQKLSTQNLQRLHYSITELQGRKKHFIETKRYSLLSKTENKLSCLKDQLQKSLFEELQEQHIEEQHKVMQFHQKQMNEFKQMWQKIFQTYVKKEEKLQKKVQKEQEKEKKKATLQLQHKAKKLRVLDSGLRNLISYENSLLKNKKYSQLANIKQKRKELQEQVQAQRRRELILLQRREQKKFKDQFMKRYNSMSMKIEEGRNFHKKIYEKHDKRLKQKFSNILTQLKHRQLLEKNKFLSK